MSVDHALVREINVLNEFRFHEGMVGASVFRTRRRGRFGGGGDDFVISSSFVRMALNCHRVRFGTSTYIKVLWPFLS